MNLATEEARVVYRFRSTTTQSVSVFAHSASRPRSMDHGPLTRSILDELHACCILQQSCRTVGPTEVQSSVFRIFLRHFRENAVDLTDVSVID